MYINSTNTFRGAGSVQQKTITLMSSHNFYEIIFSTDSDKSSDEDYLECRLEYSEDVIIEICFGTLSTSAHSLD